MNTEYKKGVFLALSAYILWGILPIYWQFVDAIGAFEILAFRIIFSVIFMIFILAVGQKQRNAFQRDMNQLLAKPIQLLAIVVAGYVITLNWGYIYLGCNERTRPTNKFRLLYKSTC